jgi:hypothetical protein
LPIKRRILFHFKVAFILGKQIKKRRWWNGQKMKQQKCRIAEKQLNAEKKLQMSKTLFFDFYLLKVMVNLQSLILKDLIQSVPKIMIRVASLLSQSACVF